MGCDADNAHVPVLKFFCFFLFTKRSAYFPLSARQKPNQPLRLRDDGCGDGIGAARTVAQDALQHGRIGQQGLGAGSDRLDMRGQRLGQRLLERAETLAADAPSTSAWVCIVMAA